MGITNQFQATQFPREYMNVYLVTLDMGMYSLTPLSERN